MREAGTIGFHSGVALASLKGRKCGLRLRANTSKKINRCAFRICWLAFVPLRSPHRPAYKAPPR